MKKFLKFLEKHWKITLSAVVAIAAFFFGVRTQSKKVKIVSKQKEFLEKEIEINHDSLKNEIEEKEEALQKQNEKIKDIYKEQEELLDAIKAKEIAREKQLRKDDKETDKVLKNDFGIKEYKK